MDEIFYKVTEVQVTSFDIINVKTLVHVNYYIFRKVYISLFSIFLIQQN